MTGLYIRPFWLLCYRWFAHLPFGLEKGPLPLPVLQLSKRTERTYIQTKKNDGSTRANFKPERANPVAQPGRGERGEISPPL